MKEIKRKLYESVNTVFDSETGEIKEKKTNITHFVNGEPEFVKLYVRDILYLVGLPKRSITVLFWLMKHMTYADDELGLCVVLNATFKKMMCSELGFQRIQTIDNCLSELAKFKVVERIGRGMYRLNPHLFGKGNWFNIKEIRMLVKYDLEGKSIKTSIKKSEEPPSQKKSTELGTRTEDDAGASSTDKSQEKAA